MAAGDVTIVIHEDELERWYRSGAVRDGLLEVAEPGVSAAQRGAPHLTGAGAASIHPEAFPAAEGWEVRVSWDPAHYYLSFHELGDRYLPALHFLASAFE